MNVTSCLNRDRICPHRWWSSQPYSLVSQLHTTSEAEVINTMLNELKLRKVRGLVERKSCQEIWIFPRAGAIKLTGPGCVPSPPMNGHHLINRSNTWVEWPQMLFFLPKYVRNLPAIKWPSLIPPIFHCGCTCMLAQIHIERQKHNHFRLQLLFPLLQYSCFALKANDLSSQKWALHLS